MRFECQRCGGQGCGDCNKTGKLLLTQCPWTYAGPGVPALIDLADLFEKGHPPVAGGVLDQAQKFVDAARFVWDLQAQCRAKLGIKGHGH